MSVLAKNFLTLENTTSTARTNWSAVRSSLVADVLRRSGRLRVRLRVHGEIHGESMLPTLWPGDVVEIESCSLEDVRPGEIVLALRDDRLVLHRLFASCTPSGFLLRGDCVPGPDPPYPSEALLGRVRRAGEGRGASAFALRPGFGVKWSRALGTLLCHCGVARRLALKIHGRRKAPAREFRNPEIAAGLRSAELTLTAIGSAELGAL